MKAHGAAASISRRTLRLASPMGALGMNFVFTTRLQLSSSQNQRRRRDIASSGAVEGGQRSLVAPFFSFTSSAAEAGAALARLSIHGFYMRSSPPLRVIIVLVEDVLEDLHTGGVRRGRGAAQLPNGLRNRRGEGGGRRPARGGAGAGAGGGAARHPRKETAAKREASRHAAAAHTAAAAVHGPGAVRLVHRGLGVLRRGVDDLRLLGVHRLLGVNRLLGVHRLLGVGLGRGRVAGLGRVGLGRGVVRLGGRGCGRGALREWGGGGSEENERVLS